MFSFVTCVVGPDLSSDVQTQSVTPNNSTLLQGSFSISLLDTKIDTCAIENNPIFLDSVMYCRGAYNYDETLMILLELIQAYYE